MIADAICDCIAGAKNFDPAKTENPFAYFTQIAWNAYLRRIKEEKKQTEIKQKLIQKAGVQEYETQEGDDTNYSNTYVDYMQKTMPEETKKEKEKKPKKKSRIENFM